MAYQTKTARKPKSRHHSSRRVAAIIISVLVVAGGVFALLYFKPFEKKADNTTGSSQRSDNAGKSDNSVDPLGEKSKDKSEQREAEKGNLKYDETGLDEQEGITGIINYAGISEGRLLINTTIYQEYGTDGTCEVSLTSESGRKLGGTVAMEPGPSSTFCSYSIPASGIEAGKWQITVFAKHGNKTGTMKTEMQL